MAIVVGEPTYAADVIPLSPTSDTESSTETFTSATYSSGSNVCGTTFVAPGSGNVIVFWSARLQSDAGGTNHRALCSVSVATGSTIGSGTVVSGSNDASALETTEVISGSTGVLAPQTRFQGGTFRIVTGLTAGFTYNVVVQFKGAVALTSPGGSIFQRDVAVLPTF